MTKVTRRDIHSRRRRRVHGELCRARVPERHRARAGRAQPQPRRRLPERRQRLAQHRRPVPGSVLLQPPAGDRDSGGTGAADRQRQQRQDARPSSAPDGTARDLQRGPARDRAAHRVCEFEPLALPGHRHLGHGGSRVADEPGLARTVSRHAAGAGRFARRLERDARHAARAHGAHRRRADDSRRAHLRAVESRTTPPRRSTSAARPRGWRRTRLRIARICRS